MIVVNFSHPLTDEQRRAIEETAQQPISAVHDVPVQLDTSDPLVPQIVSLVDAIPITGEEWQTLPILVNLPGLSVAAGVLLAELHGRMGYFPTCLRLRPVVDSVPVRYEFAEMIQLHRVREEARSRRGM